MAIPFSRILSKNDQALKAYLVSVLPAGTKVFAGKEITDKSAPCVLVLSESSKVPVGEEFTGNRLVQTSVTVKTSPADPADPAGDSDTLVSLVFDALQPGGPGDFSALPALLNALVPAIVDYTADFSRVTGEEQELPGESGDFWWDVINLEIHCYPQSGL